MEKLKNIPIGNPEVYKDREKLPAVEVENQVIWTNPNFSKMPFDFKVGEQSKLGVFYSTDPDNLELRNAKIRFTSLDKKTNPPVARYKIESQDSKFDLETREGQARNGLLSRIVFEDNDGRLYRDVGLKGVGRFTYQNGKAWIVNPYHSGDRVSQDHSFGVRNESNSRYDAEITEKLVKLGVRTHRILAIIKINEIIAEEDAMNKQRRKSRKISLDEAKEKQYIHPKVNPIVEVRAFGTVARVFERPLRGGYDWRESFVDGKINLSCLIEDLEDAKKLVAEEIGIENDKFGYYDYFKWLVKTSGKNLGIMHKNGYTHGYATTMNITLDGRIVDFDSVSRDVSRINSDYETLKDTLCGNRSFRDGVNKFILALSEKDEKTQEQLNNLTEEKLKIFFDEGYDEGLEKK